MIFRGRHLILLVFTTFLGAGCAGGVPAARVAAAGSGRLTIEMDGFRNDAGRVLVTLFAGPDQFPDGTEGVRTATATIAEGRASAVFDPLPWGEYAVSVLHDEDGDGRMGRSWLGVPKEGHGASNNPQKRFGPPDYDEARFFFVAPERTIRIVVRYVEPGPKKR